MSSELIGVIGILFLFVLLAMRMYIGMAMMVVGLIGTAFITGWDPAVNLLGLLPMNESKSYNLSVIPLFILMGQFAFISDISSDIYKTVYNWMGHLRGGLAMATMDCIKYAGGKPVNFLDVGGGASAEQIENGFRILQSDENVLAILINIFGGILRCDRLANGVVQAAKKVGMRVPVIIRMEGTNLDAGRKILADSGLDLINAKDLKDAAEKLQSVISKTS